MGFKIEICVTNAESAIKAQSAGAHRIELCANLQQGGVTPGLAMTETVRRNLKIGVNIMVRPREGNFVFSDTEFQIMLKDIHYFRKAGADGIVTGILKKDGSVDVSRCRELVKAAGEMNVTFHRAFDITPDPFDSLEKIIKCGFKRILTSGQKQSAFEGRKLIKDLIKKAGSRIIIMPGAGINDGNAAGIVSYTGAKEIHLSAKLFEKKPGIKDKNLRARHAKIINEYRNLTVDEKIIQKIRKISDNS